MKRIFLLLGALTLCLAALALQSSAEAAARVFRLRGGSQIAFSTFSREDGTLVRNTTIAAIKGFIQSLPTKPTDYQIERVENEEELQDVTTWSIEV